jgi:glycosyltransferase involved in cell wall biosynthesis
MKIQFTLNEDDNRYAKSLYNKVKQSQLPVEFIGTIDHNELVEQYRSHILIFPSLIESQGFPLTEAMQVGAMIVCIDRPYARESLLDYPNVKYFDSSASLAKIFQSLLTDGYIIDQLKSSNRFVYPSLIKHLEKVQK